MALQIEGIPSQCMRTSQRITPSALRMSWACLAERGFIRRGPEPTTLSKSLSLCEAPQPIFQGVPAGFTPKTLARGAHQGCRLACRCKARSRSVKPPVLRGSGYLAACQPFSEPCQVGSRGSLTNQSQVSTIPITHPWDDCIFTYRFPIKILPFM